MASAHQESLQQSSCIDVPSKRQRNSESMGQGTTSAARAASESTASADSAGLSVGGASQLHHHQRLPAGKLCIFMSCPLLSFFPSPILQTTKTSHEKLTRLYKTNTSSSRILIL
jgi:hypothetical protein